MPSQVMSNDSVLELLDRSRDQVSILCGQYHALKHEFEKLTADKNELQKHYILHYEMSHALNLEMHKQMEILKRIQASCTQVLPYLPPEPQAQLAQALEHSKQLICHDPGMYQSSQINAPVSVLPPPPPMGMHSLPPGHPGMHMLNGHSGSYTPIQSMSMNGVPPTIISHGCGNSMPPVSREDCDMSNSPSGRSLIVQQTGSTRFTRNSSKASEGSMSNGMMESGAGRSTRDRGGSSGGSASSSNGVAASSKHRPRRNASNDKKNESSDDTNNATEDENSTSSDNDNESNGTTQSSPRTKSGTSSSPASCINEAARGSSCSMSKYHHHNGKVSSDYMISGGGIPPQIQHHHHVGGSGGGLPPLPSPYMRVPMNSQCPPCMMSPGAHLSGGIPSHSMDMPPNQGFHSGGPPGGSMMPSNSYMRSHSMRPAYDSPMPPHMNSRMRLPPPPPPPAPYNMQHMMLPGPNSRSATCGASSYHHGHSGPRNSNISHDESSMVNSPGFSSGAPASLNTIGTLPHGEVICAITMSNPVRHIFTGGKGSVKVWEANSIGMSSIAPVLLLDCFVDKYIRSCKLLPYGDVLLVGGESETLVLWDLNTGQQTISMSIRSVIETNYAACYAVAVSPDGKLCYSCINDGKIAIWDLSSRTLVRELVGHENGSSCIDLLNDGVTFWTGGLDHEVRHWDLRGEGRSLNEYHCDAQVFTLSLAPNADWLAVGLENSTVEVFHPKSNDRYTINAHESCVMSLKVAKSGRWMVSTGKDATVRCFRMPRRIEDFCCRESNLMLSCDIADNETLLVAGSANNSAMVYKPIF